MDNNMENEQRRSAVIGLIGATAAMVLAGVPRRSPAASNPAAPPTGTPACVVRPKQTEGPFFIDEKLNRSDIRADPVDGVPKAGAELRLAFNVLQLDGSACKPIAGAIVDIWHCDAAGVYAGVDDGTRDTRGKKFLRGYQVTNNDGIARFITIYPGWYQGRTVHIHFKIRTDAAARNAREFTSQLYFDDALSDHVFAEAPYAANGKRDRKNAGDGIYRRGGNELMLFPTRDAKTNVYVAAFDIGLQLK